MTPAWLAPLVARLAAVAARYPARVPDVVWGPRPATAFDPRFYAQAALDQLRRAVPMASLLAKVESTYGVEGPVTFPRYRCERPDLYATVGQVAGLDRKAAKNACYAALYGGKRVVTRPVVALDAGVLEYHHDRRLRGATGYDAPAWTVRARIPDGAVAAIWDVWRERREVDVKLGRDRPYESLIVGPAFIRDVAITCDERGCRAYDVVFQGTGPIRVVCS